MSGAARAASTAKASPDPACANALVGPSDAEIWAAEGKVSRALFGSPVNQRRPDERPLARWTEIPVDVDRAFRHALEARVRGFDRLSQQLVRGVTREVRAFLGESERLTEAALNRIIEDLAAEPVVERLYAHRELAAEGVFEPETDLARFFATAPEPLPLGALSFEAIKLTLQYGVFDERDRVLYAGPDAASVLTGLAAANRGRRQHVNGAQGRPARASLVGLDRAPSPEMAKWLAGLNVTVDHDEPEDDRPYRVITVFEPSARDLDEVLERVAVNGRVIILNRAQGQTVLLPGEVKARGFTVVRWDQRRVVAGRTFRATVLNRGPVRVPERIKAECAIRD